MGSHAAVGVPSTSTSPEVGVSSRFTILSAVVFPEPLRPSSTSVSPLSTEKVSARRMSEGPWARGTEYPAPRNSTMALMRQTCRWSSSVYQFAEDLIAAVVSVYFPLRYTVRCSRRSTLLFSASYIATSRPRWLASDNS